MRVVRLVAKDTVEQSIRAIQASKQELMDAVGRSKEELRSLRLDM